MRQETWNVGLSAVFRPSYSTVREPYFFDAGPRGPIATYMPPIMSTSAPFSASGFMSFIVCAANVWLVSM